MRFPNVLTLLRALLLLTLCTCTTDSTGGSGGGGDGAAVPGGGDGGAPGGDGGPAGDGGGDGSLPSRPLRAVISASPRRLRATGTTTVTLDGSASLGDNLRYRWDVGRARFVEGDASSPAPKIEVNGTLPLAVSLVVENPQGKDMAGATLTLNQAPSARIAGGLRVVPPGQAIGLDASGSSDPDGDALTFSYRLLQQPGGGALAAQGSAATLTPQKEGLHQVEVTVSDGLEEGRAQAAVLVRSGDSTAPSASLTAVPNLVTVGDTVTLQAQSSDNGAVVQRSLQVNGAALALQNDSATYKPAAPGRYLAVLDVSDAAGNRQRATAEIFARAAGAVDGNNLQVELTGPDENADLDRPTDIIGSARGDNFAGYVLEARPARPGDPSPPAFRSVAAGAAAVQAGRLGTLDTTLLANDTYELRLTAYDTFGHSRFTSRAYVVSGRRKSGGMNLSLTDAEVRSGPVQFNLIREYSSQRKARGDFGVGWRLQVSSTQLEISTTPGEGWAVGCSFFGGMTITPLRGHRLTLRLGDSTYRFFFNPQPKGCFGFAFVSARFDALPGTSGTLVPDGPTDLTYNDAQKIFTGDGFGNGLPYGPSGYTLTTEDGYKLHFTAAGRMDRFTAPTGVEVTVDDSGVHRGADYDARFTRDSAGRITRINLADDRSRSYQYDGNGDLILTGDFDGNQALYRYDEDHNLSGLYSPSGRPIQRNEYDAAGRLIAIVDGAGRRLTFEHRLGERQEVFTDRLGRTSTVSYDEAGNIVRATDAAGGTTSATYDARGNPLTRTDELGKITRYEYDGSGNLTKVTDPLGRASRFVYDAAGRVTEQQNPAGQKASYAYDAAGNRVREELPGGAVRTWSYDASGRVTERTLESGDRLRYSYDGGGRLSGVSDAGGTSSSYSYDSRGHLSERTVNLDTGAGMRMVTAKVQHSKQGLFVSSTPPEGGTTSLKYNVEGAPSGYSDALGRESKVEPNSNGVGSRLTNPGGATYSVLRNDNDDAIGFVSSEGPMALREVDPLGRTTAETDATGNTVRRSYDAAGRLTKVTSAAGGVTTLEYDDAGQLTALTLPSGARSEYGYNLVGDMVSVKDPYGQVQTREVDFFGHTTLLKSAAGRTLFSASYDKSGRPLSVTDPAGGVTRYQHGAYGLEAITDATGATTALKNNGAGAVTQITDARGKVTRFEVGSAGQMLSRTLPLGGKVSYQYDDARRLIGVSGAAGERLTLEYDASGRPQRRASSDGAVEIYGYGDRLDGPASQVTTEEGITQILRDPDGRLLRLLNPDGSEVSYKYQAERLAEVTTASGTTRYQYDLSGRLTRATAPDGSTLELTYDLLDRVVSQRLPGGVTVSYRYDDDTGLLLSYSAKRGAATLLAEDYGHDAAGRINRVSGADGRVRSFSYDAAGRLLSETTEQAGKSATVRYSYDEIGNRKTRSDGAATTSYEYDDDNRLTSDGTYSYQYDAAGRLTQRSGAGETLRLRYNGFGRLVEVSREGGSGPRLTRYRYDAFGGLAGREVDGKAERYLNDYSTGLPVVLEERGADGQVTRNLLSPQGLRQNLWGRVRGAEARYALLDGGGSLRQLLRPDGTSEGQIDYDAFGVEQGQALPGLPYRYVGERYDDATGLYHLRARRYAPALGRFLSRDPELYSTTDPRVYNPYHYAGGDPVNFRDPDGRLAMLGYLVGLSKSQEFADAAASILSAALIGGALGSVGTGQHSGTYSSTAFDVKSESFKAYFGRLSFQDGTKFFYLQLDGTLLPFKGLGQIQFNYKILNLGGIGEAFGVYNEFAWAGVCLWTELAASQSFEGTQAGSWLHLRLMVMPSIWFSGARREKTRSNVGGLIGSFGTFNGIKIQFGKLDTKPFKIEGKVGLALHSDPERVTGFQDFPFDCTLYKLFPLSTSKTFLTGEFCNLTAFGGGGRDGKHGPATGSGD